MNVRLPKGLWALFALAYMAGFWIVMVLEGFTILWAISAQVVLFSMLVAIPCGIIFAWFAMAYYKDNAPFMGTLLLIASYFPVPWWLLFTIDVIKNAIEFGFDEEWIGTSSSAGGVFIIITVALCLIIRIVAPTLALLIALKKLPRAPVPDENAAPRRFDEDDKLMILAVHERFMGDGSSMR